MFYIEKEEEVLRSWLNNAYMDGAIEAIEAYRKILNTKMYDAVKVFGRGDVACMLSSMNARQIIESAHKVDEWIEREKGQYNIGQTVLDPCGKLCMITNINTGDSAKVLGGYDVLYPNGMTNRWPIGSELKGVTDEDGDLLSNLLDALQQSEGCENETD